MLLNKLFDKAPEIEIENLAVDSRVLNENGIFFCVEGIKYDGHEFIEEAINNGAKVIIHSKDIDRNKYPAIYIKVDNVLNVLNKIAEVFYQHPSRDIDVYSVTGSNGKTSCASILRQILSDFMPTAYIGTLGIKYLDQHIQAQETTPSTLNLNKYLLQMKEAGIKALTLECTSIALEQHRTDSIYSVCAIYTNLSKDKLERHGTMHDYFLAKKHLFDNLNENAYAITNVDDEYGLEIVSDTKAKIVTYGINNVADYMASEIKINADHTSFNLTANSKTYFVNTNLVGEFNIYNILAVIATLNSRGLDIEEIIVRLNNLYILSGRMQRIDLGQNFNCFVDFAKTESVLKGIYTFASNITPSDKKIVAVFGSEGVRELNKKRMQARLADKYCDMIILTEDDPREEDSYKICEEIARYIENKPYIIVNERKEAINAAIDLLNSKDTLLILGKGDDNFIYRAFGKENYQGDYVIARECIKKRMSEENEII